MKEGFDINIKDHFIEQELYKSIYNKIAFQMYSEEFHFKFEEDRTFENEHLFYGAKVEKEISDYIRKKCEKLYRIKLKENYCAYTMVTRNTPMVHRDIDDNCTHQVLIYIRGDESLHRGTGFYLKDDNGNLELNTHIGFKQNRAIFWEASAYHSPLIWSDDNKNVRFSFIAQYKKIKQRSKNAK